MGPKHVLILAAFPNGNGVHLMESTMATARALHGQEARGSPCALWFISGRSLALEYQPHPRESDCWPLHGPQLAVEVVYNRRSVATSGVSPNLQNVP